MPMKPLRIYWEIDSMVINGSSIGMPPSAEPIYNALFSFVDSVVRDFKPLSQQPGNGGVVESEDRITEDLSDYLNDKAKSTDHSVMFNFINQSQGKADIGVKYGQGYNKNNRQPFCWIEAKRLPTPVSIRRDEREYVYVDKTIYSGNGGIQRFKERKHAKDHDYAIMVGYIQQENNSYWFDKINQWISSLAEDTSISLWNSSDEITAYNSHYLSTHIKNNDTRICIHHFWINLVVN